MGSHLIDGKFQSDKYPTTPRGKVPLSVKDMTAQDLLWEYAQRHRSVDAEFSDDLETALRTAGYTPATPEGLYIDGVHVPGAAALLDSIATRDAEIVRLEGLVTQAHADNQNLDRELTTLHEHVRDCGGTGHATLATRDVEIARLRKETEEWKRLTATARNDRTETESQLHMLTETLAQRIEAAVAEEQKSRKTAEEDASTSQRIMMNVIQAKDEHHAALIIAANKLLDEYESRTHWAKQLDFSPLSKALCDLKDDDDIGYADETHEKLQMEMENPTGLTRDGQVRRSKR